MQQPGRWLSGGRESGRRAGFSIPLLVAEVPVFPWQICLRPLSRNERR